MSVRPSAERLLSPPALARGVAGRGLRAQLVRRIAIVRALQLGDLLVAVPALRAIRAGFCGAEITLIGLPWAAEFAARFSRYLDRFIAFPGYPGIPERPVVPERTAAFLAEQRAYGYDLVVQLHGSGRASTPFALALGGRVTAGYYVGARPDDLTIGAPYPDDQPEIERNLLLANLLGCPVESRALTFPLTARDHAEAARLLRPLAGHCRPWVAIHPGARAPARRWPAHRFAQVAATLARRHGAQIVLTGSPDERETADSVAAPMEVPALNLAGRTSLGALAALIARMDLFIGNDTGPAHLAQAVGTPSVTLFGPADVVRWAPLDQTRHRVVRHPVACSPCPYWACPIDHRCLLRIEPEVVSAVAEDLLTEGGAVCDA